MRPARPTPIRIASAAAGAAAVVALVACVHFTPAARAGLWAAVLTASFTGWGSLVRVWLAPGRRVDWGLRAAWGLSLFLFVGGFLCLVHLAVRATLIAHVGLGLACLFYGWTERPPRLPSARSLRRRGVLIVGRAGTSLLVVAGYGLGALAFFASLGAHSFQPSDDLPFYFLLAEKLVQAGSMFEPYAGRRVAVLGGQVYVHGAYISVASPYYLHAIDLGISTVLVVALVVGAVRERRPAARALPLALALLVFFTLRDVRVNTTSHVSSLAVFIALYRTLRVPLAPPAIASLRAPVWPMEPGRLVVLAALTLALMLLRVSNVSAAMLFVFFALLSDFVLGARGLRARDAWVSLLRAGGLYLGVVLVGLAPWSLLEHASAGTFLYPLGHSHITPGWTFGLQPTHDLEQEGTELVANLSFGRPLGSLVPFLVAGMVPLAGRRRNDVVALSLACLFAFALLSHNGVALGPHHIARYGFAYTGAVGVVLALSVEAIGARAAIVAAVVGMHLAMSVDDARGQFDAWTRAAAHAGQSDHDFASLTADYADIQSHVPPGATMAIAVFEGFRFDFRRNPIYTLDVLGGMGPPPGWPVHKGPRALGDYLVANGVQYLVWVDFNLPSEFYNHAHWTSHLSKTGHYLQSEAGPLLDAEDSIEKLAAMRRVVYRAHGMTVVDLSAPAGVN